MCESVYVDEDVLYKVPEGVSDKAAAVIEPCLLYTSFNDTAASKFNPPVCGVRSRYDSSPLGGV